MEPAPAWVTYVSLAVAAVAALASAGALLLSYLGHRATRPRVALTALSLPLTGNQREGWTQVGLVFKLRLRGSATVQVVHLLLDLGTPAPVPVRSEWIWDGPPLPHRFSGPAEQVWIVDLSALVDSYRKAVAAGAERPAWNGDLAALVQLGDGRRIRQDRTFSTDTESLHAIWHHLDQWRPLTPDEA